MNLPFESVAGQYLTVRSVYIMSVVVLWSIVGLMPAAAQQQIGYIESDYILEQMPEYASVQQELDQLEQDWRTEIREQEEEVDALVEEFQARELLYTPDEQEQQQERIREARREAERLRDQYFGPEGQLFQRQRELMRPVQERVMNAVETVAESGGYDYVFDKSGDYLFMYARPQHNLSEDVIFELDLDADAVD